MMPRAEITANPYEWLPALQYVILCVSYVVMLFVIVDDLRNYRITNSKVLALLLLFVAFCVVKNDLAMLTANGKFALSALLALLIAYSLKAMGGGDAKLLVAAALWLGPDLCLLFSLLLLGCTIVYYLGTKVGMLPFQKVNGRSRIPYGPGIGVAWIISMMMSAKTAIF